MTISDCLSCCCPWFSFPHSPEKPEKKEIYSYEVSKDDDSPVLTPVPTPAPSVPPSPAASQLSENLAIINRSLPQPIYSSMSEESKQEETELGSPPKTVADMMRTGDFRHWDAMMQASNQGQAED